MITFENVSKNFNSVSVLRNINLEIKKGETLCLLGKSGSGKTTLLKMINKLVIPSGGVIQINNQPIDKERDIDIRRKIGYVLQEGGLFPHMTIYENITLPMKLAKKDKATIIQRVNELIQMIGLDATFLDRYPDTLSGGQRQRIGIARAIANEPSLLLLDEPFSALDPVLRDQLQDEFLEMVVLKSMTKIIVTHDISEALKLSDRICLIKDGNILFTGTPSSFLNSEEENVKAFIGEESGIYKMSFLKWKDISGKIPSINSKNDSIQVKPNTPVYTIFNSKKEFIHDERSNKYFLKSAIKSAYIEFIKENL